MKNKKTNEPSKKSNLTRIPKTFYKSVYPNKKPVQQQNGDTEDHLSLVLSQDSVLSSQESQSSQNSRSSVESDVESLNQKNTKLSQEAKEKDGVTELCEQLDYVDIDAETLGDPFQVSLYAADIFQYYKERELKFQVPPYLDHQKNLTPHMRAILVDWLVEVQENFELNHETLYLAVKLTDLYLVKKMVARENLQLVGSIALFIACKFDERTPPLLDDFMYVCDDAYNREEMLAMEQSILKTVGFDIGIPLSYRFLRRYARCGKSPMEILTLGRYILEMSLMDYEFVKYRDSKLAAACLLLAFKMKKSGQWDNTMVHFTGYQAEELMPIVIELNNMLSNFNKNLMTVRSKYSHKIFYEVAKTPPLDVVELCL